MIAARRMMNMLGGAWVIEVHGQPRLRQAHAPQLLVRAKGSLGGGAKIGLGDDDPGRAGASAGPERAPGWRAIKVRGPLDFALTVTDDRRLLGE